MDDVWDALHPSAGGGSLARRRPSLPEVLAVRPIRIALLCALLALPLIVTAGASALDIEIDDQPPDAEVGTPYTFQFTAEEGCKPYVFSYSGGEVPPGLTITTDGRLTGTPTEAGFYKFYAAVDDHNDGKICFGSMQSQGTFEMVVLRHLSITTDQLPTARPGQYYSTTLAASDGEVFQWEVSEGALPPGMKMAGDFSKTATISGTPATAGSYTFTATVMDLSRVRVDSKQFTLNVATPLAPSAPSLGPSRWAWRTEDPSPPPAAFSPSHGPLRAARFRPGWHSRPAGPSPGRHVSQAASQ